MGKDKHPEKKHKKVALKKKQQNLKSQNASMEENVVSAHAHQEDYRPRQFLDGESVSIKEVHERDIQRPPGFMEHDIQDQAKRSFKPRRIQEFPLYNRKKRAFAIEQIRMIDDYVRIMEVTDERVMTSYDSVVQQNQKLFSLNIRLYGFALLIAIGMIVAAILMVFMDVTPSRIRDGFAVMALIGGILILYTSLTRGPERKFQEMTSNLIKTNILMLGFIRQIRILDASFRSWFSTSESWDTQQLTEVIKNIHAVIDLIMVELNRTMNDR